MPKTGVFFTEVLKGKDWPVIDDKFRNFPEVMAEALKNPNIALYTSKPVDERLLYEVHTHEVIANLKSAWYYEGAVRSVGGCVEALERIYHGEIVNALVFNVAAGHHAGPSYAWGGTYVSCAGPMIVNAREKFGVHRFAIIDTDSHHGDGDRAMFKGDHDVLHVCFCSMNAIEDEGTKIDVDVGWRTTDEEYLEKVEREFKPRALAFKPYAIIHFFGHDTCEGDYGDRGLTPSFYLELAKLVKSIAELVCQGRYVVITGGGYRRDVAEYVFPRVIQILAE
jgi:acetoin utilization deacetylase AcuC-like enzyme